MNNPIDRHPAAAILKAIALGGLAAGVLDAVDALVAFKLVLGFDPIPIYQFVASGALGPTAFSGGAATALLGLGFHFLIAFSAAAVFALASLRLPVLRQRPAVAGVAFGVSVYAFMNYLVLPLSLVGPASFSLALLVNGVLGHALFVGVPIAYAARACLSRAARPFQLAETAS